MTTRVADKLIVQNYLTAFPNQARAYIDKLSDRERLDLIVSLDDIHALCVLTFLNPIDFSSLLVRPEGKTLQLLARLEPMVMIRAVRHLSSEDAENFLTSLPKSLATEIREIMTYPPDTAGWLMDPRVMMFHQSDTIGLIFERIAHYRKRFPAKRMVNLYVVDLEGRLLGQLPIQEVVGLPRSMSLDDLSIHPSTSVSDMTPREDVITLVETNRIATVPVVNQENQLLGIIRQADLVDIMHEEAFASLQQMVGASKAEKALSKPFFAVKKRLPWLSINLLTTFLAAFVVGIFEGTIAKITALAVLLPVVAGQSGNTGAQAQAVTMRGLALREIRLRHKWLVLWKEGCVGLYNGTAIGLMVLVSVYFWSQSLPLGIVIGVSMILAMFAASLAGAAIPMILTSLGQDPAQSSSIILTTITDIVGFLSFLGLATIFANYLI